MYFHLVIEEINGEQEYSYDYLVNAENEREANRIAEELAESFYGDDNVEKNGDYYEMFGGSIAVKVESLIPTTKSRFIKHMLNKLEVK